MTWPVSRSLSLSNPGSERPTLVNVATKHSTLLVPDNKERSGVRPTVLKFAREVVERRKARPVLVE